MRVLGIETSCDDTSVALYDGARGTAAHLISSQVDLHDRFGGATERVASLLFILTRTLAEVDVPPLSIIRALVLGKQSLAEGGVGGGQHGCQQAELEQGDIGEYQSAHRNAEDDTQR